MTLRFARLGPVFRLGGVGAAVLALAASSTDGERASSGWCPDGEQCADDTPEGLAFEGAQVSWFLGNGVATTAVGGFQTLHITDRATGEPLDLPFLVAVTNPAAHAAAVGDGPSLALSVSAEGEGFVRVSRVADDYLFDRLAIDSKPIARMAARPTMKTSWPYLLEDGWAVLAGGTAEIAVALYAADDGWLIDESMQMETPTPSRRTSWDSWLITPDAAGTYEIAVSAGDVTAAVPVDVVASIDELQAQNSGATVSAGQTFDSCFTALNGARAVYGATWSFRITGPALPTDASDQPYDHCVRLRVTAVGPIEVTATAGGRTLVATYTAVGSARRAPAQRTWLPASDLGERAAAAADAE